MGRRRSTEIDTVAALDAHLASGESLRGLRLQDLDLSDHAGALLARSDWDGVVVLGGTLPPSLESYLRDHGALVFSADPQSPVDVYRATLYQPAELYAGLAEGGYPATPDCRAYDWAVDASLAGDVLVTLLRAIHDDSVTDALDEALAGSRAVGVMGGHAVQRGTADYAATARLGHALAQAGLVVLTGGGPGAMEAANLGAFTWHTSELVTALKRLGAVPTFDPDIGAWAGLALDIRVGLRPAGSPAGLRSIGIPTWFYGHEPPNVFCDGIGKYFSNALREDGLLARCNGGVVVMPGEAGTVQEIFQAVTSLYYAKPGSPAPPLVLVGEQHWTRTVPVWPVVQSMLAKAGRAANVHLVDDPADATAIITGTATDG